MRNVRLMLGLAACLLPAAAAAQRASTTVPGRAIAARPAAELGGAPWLSPPMLRTTDIDSTTAPCEDFYQFAAGRWDDRAAPPLGPSLGPSRSARVGQQLLDLIERAPQGGGAADLAAQVLGTFYGSCLGDGGGAAEGAVGDSARARYCLRVTRRYLDPVLFELLLTRVWPLAGRAESRQLWEQVKAAAYERVRASAAMSDSTQRELLQEVATMTLRMGAKHGDEGAVPLLPFLDTVAVPHAAPRYAGLQLSATDFAQNLARVQAVADTASPFRQTVVTPLLDRVMVGASSFGAEGPMRGRNYVNIVPSPLIPPVVAGTVDVGGWYGMIGSLLAHELVHRFDEFDELYASGRSLTQPWAFTREQLGEQFRPWSEGQPFQNQLGILIAYDAFERAMQGRPRTRLEGLTPEQRFFIGVAQFLGFSLGWRGVAVWHWRKDVNGTLSVMPGFARAFGCKAGSPMAGGRVWWRDPRPPRSAPRPAGELTEREWQYRVDWRPAEWFWSRGISRLTSWALRMRDPQMAEQLAALDTLLVRYEAERRALTDSLGLTAPGAVPVSRWQRTWRLFVRQLGEARQRLAPAQRPAFDAEVRTWLTQHTEPSWQVAVPWLTP